MACFCTLMFIEKLVIFTSELGYLLINCDSIVWSKLREKPVVLAYRTIISLVLQELWTFHLQEYDFFVPNNFSIADNLN